MKQPCEELVMEFLPAIRAELSKKLIEKGYTQSKIAESLGISKPAVSQYVNNKRGTKLDLEEETRSRIESAAEKIKNNEEEAKKQVCIICDFIKDQELRCESSVEKE